MIRPQAPDILIRQWLQNPHAITVGAFVLAGAFLGIAGWLIQRNLRHNEPGLRAPLALPFALTISAAGVFGAWRLPSPRNTGTCIQTYLNRRAFRRKLHRGKPVLSSRTKCGFQWAVAVLLTEFQVNPSQARNDICFLVCLHSYIFERNLISFTKRGTAFSKMEAVDRQRNSHRNESRSAKTRPQ